MCAARAGGSGPDGRAQGVGEREPVDQRLGHPQQPEGGVVTQVEDGDQVGVVEAGEGLRLAPEAGGEVGRVVGACLQGDGAVEAAVVGPVDGAHAARSDRGGDRVAIGEVMPDDSGRVQNRPRTLMPPGPGATSRSSSAVSQPWRAKPVAVAARPVARLPQMK